MAGAEETDELKELAEGLIISGSAHFLGRRSDISQLLSAMDVFIFPSFREGLPVSVVEAQAAGLPERAVQALSDDDVRLVTESDGGYVVRFRLLELWDALVQRLS